MGWCGGGSVATGPLSESLRRGDQEMFVGMLACRRRTQASTRRVRYIFGTNMMCAFGVPGYMIHGVPSAGVAVMPVEAAVAPGM